MVMEDPSAAFPPSSNGPDFPARFDVTWQFQTELYLNANYLF